MLKNFKNYHKDKKDGFVFQYKVWLDILGLEK
jgi:hypothetical protein